MGCTNIDAVVIIENCNTVELSTDGQAIVSGAVSGAVVADVTTQMGELSWKEQVISVTGPVTSVTHAKLSKTIKSIIYVDGAPVRWAKVGIVQDKDAGTLDFSASPYTVTEEVIFEYK